MADEKILQSAHDCSDGGFAVALAECCMTGLTHEAKTHGAKVTLPGAGRLDGRLFGEAQSRAIVSCKPAMGLQVEALAKKFRCSLCENWPGRRGFFGHRKCHKRIRQLIGGFVFYQH